MKGEEEEGEELQDPVAPPSRKSLNRVSVPVLTCSSTVLFIYCLKILFLQIGHQERRYVSITTKVIGNSKVCIHNSK